MLAEPIRRRDFRPPHDANTQTSLPWPPPLFMLHGLPFEARRAASVLLPPLRWCYHHCTTVMVGQVTCQQGCVNTLPVAPATCTPRAELSPSSPCGGPCIDATWCAPIAAWPSLQNTATTLLRQPREDKAPAPSYPIRVLLTRN
jgi:hypothetical protein